MSGLVGIITSRLAGPIAAGVAVLLAFLLAVQTVRLGDVRGDLKTTRGKLERSVADLATCRGNTERLQSAIASQNTAVAALKADSDRRGQMLADALHSARKAADAASQRADRIMAIRPAGADVCERLLDVDRKIRSSQ